MPIREPNPVRYWLGIFFGTFDMPVFTEELEEFWNSLTPGERYMYACQMEMCWDWWNRQGVYSVRKRLDIVID
jgi:hypothetical protein